MGQHSAENMRLRERANKQGGGPQGAPSRTNWAFVVVWGCYGAFIVGGIAWGIWGVFHP